MKEYEIFFQKKKNYKTYLENKIVMFIGPLIHFSKSINLIKDHHPRRYNARNINCCGIKT
jgi:hypothetical protein